MEEMKVVGRYMVFNVGCIECGVSSNIVGFYNTLAEAEKIVNICQETLSWRQGGQNSFEVFDVASEQPEEYTTAITSVKEKEE